MLRPPSASERMPKKRFEQRLEDYRNGKGKKKSPQRRLRALGIIGIA